MPKLPKEVVIATKPESPSLEIKTNDSSVDYTITPGLYFGRAEIEKFVLYYKKHTDTDYSHIDVDIHQLSGSLELQGGNQYDFYATAVNQSYESDGSAAQSYILGKVPYNVKLSYKVDVSSKTINYTITADSNADTPVTNYRLMFKDTNDANWKWNDIKENNYKIDGCTLGHTYLLKAIAFNAVGESNVTDMQTVTVGNVLSAPQLNLSFNGSLNYQITPADDSSNPLKLNYYTIYYKRESDMDWQTFRTTNLTGTIPNAEIGQTYLSQVSASNSVGESQKSNVVSIKMIDTSKIDSLLTFKTDQPQDVTSISYTVNQSLLGFYKTKVASITVWQHYGNTHSPSDVSSSTVLNSSRVNLQSGNGTLRLMSGNAYGAYGKYGCYLYVYAKLIDGSADEF
ncbi:fibronectin type III domain-containing protein, partial [Apilactobacillus ozensis]